MSAAAGQVLRRPSLPARLRARRARTTYEIDTAHLPTDSEPRIALCGERCGKHDVTDADIYVKCAACFAIFKRRTQEW